MLLGVQPRRRSRFRSAAAALSLGLVVPHGASVLAAIPDRSPEITGSATSANASEDVSTALHAATQASRSETEVTLPPVDRAPSATGYHPRFWLIDPRHRAVKAEPDLLKFDIHGDYQVRYAQLPELPLENYGFDDYARNRGATQRLEHRMRFNPRVSYRRWLTVVGQFDVPYGTLVGQSTNHLTTDPEPMRDAQPMQFAFRWLYADIVFGANRVTLGQQPARWGSGLVFDSGDERQSFGDTRLGTIVERIAYLGRPFGSKSNFELLLASDWVYADARSRWLDGDRTIRGLAGFSYVASPDRRLGLLVIGERFQPQFANSELRDLRPIETTATFDFAGEAAYPVPGQSARVFAAGEAALVTGRSDITSEVFSRPRVSVQRMGAMARLGLIAIRGAESRRWGKWGLQFEWGYASGDANPSDSVDRRFVANPARRVGLILFDEVLRWKSARSAAALEDARIGMRPTAASLGIPTAGGVSGATYFSLEWLYRPLPNFDLRAAALLAQTAADFVDPARLVITGRWSNYDNGSPSHRDLGMEFDFATEYRQPLDNGLGLSIGAEAGVLLPGRALADTQGHTIGALGLARGRFGFYF